LGPGRVSLDANQIYRQSGNGIPRFFTLWKEADPDIPILKQAKAEYAKLQ